MKGLDKLLLIIVVALAVAVPAQADTDIKVSGQVRLREQLDDKSFDTSAANQFAEIRTRVGVEGGWPTRLWRALGSLLPFLLQEKGCPNWAPFFPLW